ncbi:MAG: hypothetical protein R6V39_08585 [Desulfovibrionales bacterium]
MMRKGIIFFLVAALSLYAFTAWGAEVKKQVSAEGYVDLVTMHCYIKNSDGTYDEYTRKGEFFKTVSADLPLLLERSHVVPINNSCYLLYVKKHLSKPDKTMVLKGAPDSLPKGWLLEKALVDVRHASSY